MTDWVSVFANGPVHVKVWAGNPNNAWDWEGTLGLGDTVSFAAQNPDEPGVTITLLVDAIGVVYVSSDGELNGTHGFTVVVENPPESIARQVSDVNGEAFVDGGFNVMQIIACDNNDDNGTNYELTPPASGLTWTPNPQVITSDYPLFGVFAYPYYPA